MKGIRGKRKTERECSGKNIVENQTYSQKGQEARGVPIADWIGREGSFLLLQSGFVDGWLPVYVGECYASVLFHD